MTAIRTLEREDLGAVARLHASDVDPEPDEAHIERFRRFFERTLFGHPWADPEIPSLVYEESGEILGCLGSNVRRMRFDGRRIRMACSAHLLAHPRVRGKAVGARLLRQYLDGPQDLTITDGANEPVRRMWEGMGGRTVHYGAVTFIRVLRPVGLAMHQLLSRLDVPAAERALTPIVRSVDSGATRLLQRRRERASESRSEQLTPARLLEELAEVADGLRLVPDYDLEYLSWLFGELERVGEERVFPDRVPRGPLVAEAVTQDGGAVGWYVCQLRSGGLCRVLQFAAQPRNVEAVLDRLAARAGELGAVGIFGRLEPLLVGPLSERRALLRFSKGKLLAYARDQEIVDAILRGEALLTRMDGEWW